MGPADVACRAYRCSSAWKSRPTKNQAMTRSIALSIALLSLVGPDLVLGAAADNGAICRQKRLHAPGLICPGDPEWPEATSSQGRPCRPWNIDSLRKLYVFGDAEQRAGAEKAIVDIWAGRNGWCPVR